MIRRLASPAIVLAAFAISFLFSPYQLTLV